jgi:arsenate reductase (thioredoxin)
MRASDAYAGVRASFDAARARLHEIPRARREILDRIADFVDARRKAGEPARLVFICTANSRRSHLGQIWAAAAAAHVGVDGIETYSGGTEATAFDPRAIAALRRVGFVVEPRDGPEDNPRYGIAYAHDRPAIESFSKRYDHTVNPREDFVAVMTCSEADENCPLVPGAALRISLPYDDPKLADGTPAESHHYDERSQQIALEMLYLFSRIADR